MEDPEDVEDIVSSGTTLTDSKPPRASNIELDEDLPLLKPPQLNNIYELSEHIWISSSNGKPYVKIFLKTKNKYYKAEFSDLSARKQIQLIDKLESMPGDATDERQKLLTILKSYQRPSNARFSKGNTKQFMDNPSSKTAISNLISPYNLSPPNVSFLESPDVGISLEQPKSMTDFESRSNSHPASPLIYNLHESSYLLSSISINDIRRRFTELQDIFIHLQQENQSLRKENWSLSCENKTLLELYHKS